MRITRFLLFGWLVLLGQVGLFAGNEPPESEERQPDQTVSFPDYHDVLADGLAGFVWVPPVGEGPFPAVIGMHGSGGACFGVGLPCTAERIAGKLQFYGKQFSDRGFLFLLIDGFSTRGAEECLVPGCPDPVLERPFDVHAGLSYLHRRQDVDTSRVGLIGWSQGGTSTMSAVASSPSDGVVPPLVVAGVFSDPTDQESMRNEGVYTAAMLYGGCGQDGRYNDVFQNYGELRVFIGDADSSVDPENCIQREEEALARGSDFALLLYAGEEHGYDYHNWDSQAAVDTRNRLWDQFQVLTTRIFADGFESGDLGGWAALGAREQPSG